MLGMSNFVGRANLCSKGFRGLNNTVMQLKKICNHPFVFEEVENAMNPYSVSNDLLWRTSGKFELLDRILPKFKRSGHRVCTSWSLLIVGIDVLSNDADYEYHGRLFVVPWI